MSFLDHVSPRILSLISEGCPWALKPGFMNVQCEDRYLDFFEVYSGKGRLNGSVAKVWCLEKHIVLRPGFVCIFFHVCILTSHQAYVVHSFEVWDNVSENILTRAGQILCFSDIIVLLVVVHWHFVVSTGLQRALRVKRGGIVWSGIKCGSWVPAPFHQTRSGCRQ